MLKEKELDRIEKENALARQHYDDWLKSQFEDETRIVLKCNICGQDVEPYHEDRTYQGLNHKMINRDISEELEFHLQSEHDANEWLNYRELDKRKYLPFFDHRGKQITFEEYDRNDRRGYEIE